MPACNAFQLPDVVAVVVAPDLESEVAEGAKASISTFVTFSSFTVVDLLGPEEL